jgi:hypothetical protein
MAVTNIDSALQTIEDGVVPVCRMRTASSTQDFVRRLIDADEKRSKKRFLVAGIVDGNPPFSWRKLREQNRGDRTNVNFGTARSYLESGDGAFYDLFSQAPGFVEIDQTHGDEPKRGEWSREMSAQADKTFAMDHDFDNDMQLSQNQMVLNGTGPLYFENQDCVFPMSVESGDLLVPGRTRSKLSRWEANVIVWDYYPPELYEFIANESAASQVGWDVEFTRMVIEKAMDIRQPDGAKRNWEFYQNELKENSYAYVEDTKICKVAHVFWKEFKGPNDIEGRVTHAIVQREDTTGMGCKYLYIKVGRYAAFEQSTHPMYFDRGRGGYHHTVTGLGVKMYGALEKENRLLCNLMDKAEAPKTLFVPKTAEAAQKFQVATFSDWGLLPPGTEVQQNPIQGFLNDGLAMFRTSSELMRSNLSQYRQPVEMEKPGNPETAFKEKMNASQQGALSNTSFSRYYRQLDALYSEIVRRLCNLNTTDQRAKDFQKRCIEAGVPKECFGRVLSVKAVRVIGEGSPFMRQQTVQTLTSVIGRCDEQGQDAWLNDYIASHAGQAAVKRYNPKPTAMKLANDQRERAMNQVAGMKVGLPPTISGSQNALTFAGVFLHASVEALKSVQKGADPKEVLSFLNLSGPATAAHIKRMENDPLRKDVVDELVKQWKHLSTLVDRLKKLVQQQDQKQKGQQQKTQGAMSDAQIKIMKTRGELQLKSQKQQHAMALKTAATRQNLAINDARTASEIHNNRLRAFRE